MITVGGTASLDGTFSVNLVNGFTPSVGDPDLNFFVLANTTGSFSTINGSGYSVLQVANGLVLRAPLGLRMASGQDDVLGGDNNKAIAANLSLSVQKFSVGATDIDEFFSKRFDDELGSLDDLLDL